MTTTRVPRSSRARCLVGAVLGLLALAGCGSDTGSTAPAATPTASSSASASAGPSDGGSATPITPSASTRPTAGPVACTSAMLRVGLSRGDGAAGSVYYSVRLTNASPHPCRTGGFGGVSLVQSATGDPVGAAADRVGTGSAKPLTLAPGGVASATLQVAQAGNYPAATCRPTPTEGFRVYPPDQTRSSFVARAATGCRSVKVHLLRLMPYVAGMGQGSAG